MASGAVEGDLSQWMESGDRWALWKDGIVPPAFYDDSVLPTEHCLDSFVGRSAVAMLEEYLGRDTPWHLQVNFPSPHAHGATRLGCEPMAIREQRDHRVRIETGELQGAERRHSFAPRFTPTSIG